MKLTYLPKLVCQLPTKVVVIRKALSSSKFSDTQEPILVGVKHPALFPTWARICGHRGKHTVLGHSSEATGILIVTRSTVGHEPGDQRILLSVALLFTHPLFFFNARANPPISAMNVVLVMNVFVQINKLLGSSSIFKLCLNIWKIPPVTSLRNEFYPGHIQGG